MGYVIDRTYVDLEKIGITEGHLMEIWGIEEVSAKELFCGKIPFTRSEILELTEYKGVNVEKLFSQMDRQRD